MGTGRLGSLTFGCGGGLGKGCFRSLTCLSPSPPLGSSSHESSNSSSPSISSGSISCSISYSCSSPSSTSFPFPIGSPKVGSIPWLGAGSITSLSAMLGCLTGTNVTSKGGIEPSLLRGDVKIRCL